MLARETGCILSVEAEKRLEEAIRTRKAKIVRRGTLTCTNTQRVSLNDLGVVSYLQDYDVEIAQELFLYEASGGDPDDLFKFITPGQDKVNLWVQMHRGDNQEVRQVVDAVDAWVESHPSSRWR